MKIEVMLISRQAETLRALRSLLSDEEIHLAAEAEGGAAALDKIDNLSPDIVVINLGAEEGDALSLAERIILHKPRCFVILLADRLDADILCRATKAGAHNITSFPTGAKEFNGYIKSVYHNESTRIKSLGEKQSITWLSKVISVFGAKGGIGKTTIATNLAVKLSQMRKKVALIDLDLQFGDVHIFLDIEPKDTVSELVSESNSLDIDSVRSYMAVHSSGVHVLCAPKCPEYAELVPAARIQDLLSLLRSYYDYVIIDMPPAFNDVTLTAIESSSLILLIAGLDISILKNSKLSLNLLDSLHQRDKVKVLVNRVAKVNAISLADVQKIIGCPIWAKIPGDYPTAVAALNRGIPIVTGSPKSELSRSFGEIADVLLSGSYQFELKTGRREHKRFSGTRSGDGKLASKSSS